MTKRVFLSYAKTDKFFGELLELKFRGEGIEVWRFVESLRGGDEWRSSIDTGIDQAGVVVLALSKESCSSHYVTYEWARAMGLAKSILPVMLEDCDRHPKLEPIQYLDFRNHSKESWAQLIARVKDMLGDSEGNVETDSASENGESEAFAAHDEGRSVPAELDERDIIARDQIKGYLNAKGFRIVSDERIRQRISGEYDSDFLNALVEKVDEFARARIRGGKIGVRLR